MPYRKDLARIHDAHFGELADNAATVLLEALVRRKLREGLVIDLGCGSGILSERMAARGYDVLGIDLSRPMLKLARRRGVPGAEFRRESVFDAELPECAAVAAVGECFNYVCDRRLSRAALSKLFRRIHRALVPGDVLLFDLSAPGRGRTMNHFSGDTWAILVSSEEDRSHRVLTRRVTTFLERGSRYRRSDETHRLWLVEKKDVLARLEAAGFRARTLPGYESFRFPRGLVGYLAVKSYS